MDIMTPMPEIAEKENSMREALTTPPTQNFDASKVAKKIPETISEQPEPTPVKKKKPRGMSAMSPEKKAAHMEKMRIASANARKKRADAKNKPTTENDALPPVPTEVKESVVNIQPPTPAMVSQPIPTPLRSSASATATPTPVVSNPIPVPQPKPTPTPASAVHRQQEIDYNKLAETMERRKAQGNRRVVTKEEINFFEQTVRANERKKTLADLEKEQEKAIQDFMSKRTRTRTMPKAEKSYAIWDNW